MPHTVSARSPARLMPRASEWHPWLTAAALVVNITSRNVHCVTIGDLATLLGMALAIATGFYLVAWLLRRATPQAAAIASTLIVGFGLYGRAFDELFKRCGLSNPPLLHACCAAAGLAFLALIWRTTGNLSRLSAWLTLTMLFVIVQSGAKHVHYNFATAAQPALVVTDDIPLKPSAMADVLSPEDFPDIYYIILDGYARADVLRDRYGLDNSAFLDGLRQRGFYVADRSCTNYPLTMFSLSSSLNLKFHDHTPSMADDRSIYEMIRAPQVARFLKQRGYRFVHFNSPWPGTSFSRTADLTIGPRRGLTDLLLIFHSFSALKFILRHSIEDEYIAVHQQAFAELPEIARLAEPTFTFAHFIAPHPPFVFDQHGRGRTDIDQTKRQSYADELIGINGEVTRIVDRILRLSSKPPIIIVQSDHGPAFFACAPLAVDNDEEWVQERVPIINAYLVPDRVRQKLYPTITPVNTFRVLLSECFGADLPMLDDRVFMTHYRAISKRPEITGQIVDGVPNSTIAVPTK